MGVACDAQAAIGVVRSPAGDGPSLQCRAALLHRSSGCVVISAYAYGAAHIQLYRAPPYMHSMAVRVQPQHGYGCGLWCYAYQPMYCRGLLQYALLH